MTKSIFLTAALLTSLTAEEVLYFSMDDADSPLTDSIGGLQASAIDNGHLYEIDGPPGFGKAIGLNDRGSWQLTQEDSAVMRDLGNDFSVAVWVYLDSNLLATKAGVNAALNRVVGDDEAWDADGWAMGVWNDGRVRFTKNGIVDIDLGNPGAVPTDEWTHIAATVSSTEGSKLFVNGTPVGSNPNTANCDTGAGRNGFLDLWAIGRTYGAGEDQWFAGNIDELHVFSHVLTEGEVADLMVVPRDPALVTNLLVSETGSNTKQTLTLTLDNDGTNNDLNLTGVTFTGSDADDFSTETLPAAIAPGGQGTLEINFNPSDGGRTYTTTAAIASNDPEKPSFEVTIEVLVLDPIIRVEGALDFGEVTVAPTSRMVTIFNDGVAEDLVVSSATVTGPRGTFFTVTPNSPTISPGGSTMLNVTFDPADGTGGFNGTLEIISNDLANPISTLPVSANTPLGPLSSHLVSHFTFDQSANVGNDRGLFDLDGTVVGESAFTTDSRIGGGALKLNGNGDTIEVGGGNEYSSLDDNGVGFTVAVWACLDEGAFGTARIFSSSMLGGFSGDGWGVGFGTIENGSLLGTTYGLLDYRSPAGAPFTLGQWHHLTYVFRNSPVSEVEFFVDGVSVGTTTSPAGSVGLNDTGNGFVIGSLDLPGNRQDYFGKVDDLRIYNIELRDEEIELLASAVGLEEDLQITSTELLDGAFRITWNSLPGRQYAVSRSYDDPNIGLVALVNWEEITDSVDTAGESTSFTDFNLPDGATRVFYRVNETP